MTLADRNRNEEFSKQEICVEFEENHVGHLVTSVFLKSPAEDSRKLRKHCKLAGLFEK